MKIFKYMLIVLIALVFNGCWATTIWNNIFREPEPPIATKIIYKDRIVYKEVPCKIPDINCSFKGKQLEPIGKLLECIVKQKQAIKTCNTKK